MLITFDEELRPLPVSVRVGQAVDVVGQAGKPKTITGFQTHTTPVLLAHGERAELATEDYVSLTPIMEGFVILRKKKVDSKIQCIASFVYLVEPSFFIQHDSSR